METPLGAMLNCEKCGASLAPLENVLLFVEKTCADCGNQIFVQQIDPKTGGVQIEKGDRVHFSLRMLQEQMKLKGGVRFSREGLDLFTRSLFLPKGDVIRNPQRDLLTAIEVWATAAESTLKQSSMAAGLDLDSEADANELARRVGEQPSAELYALVLDIACDHAKKGLEAGDAWAAAGAAAMAGACNAMLMFKKEVEETVWRGHSVEVLRSALQIWTGNAANDDEEFWQRMFAQYSFVLSQVFSAPIVVIADKAYVGGKSVENTGGSIADFLFRNELTHRTALVELKVPTTPLLSTRPYRNAVYAPSPELAGAVAQVSSYSARLAEDVMLRVGTKTPFDPARSECVVIVGTAKGQLEDHDQRRSFELYRSELRNVRVVTYDELFGRVASLLQLFGG